MDNSQTVKSVLFTVGEPTANGMIFTEEALRNMANQKPDLVFEDGKFYSVVLIATNFDIATGEGIKN